MSGENNTMEKNKSKGWFLAAVAFTIVCILQVIGLIRYVGRLPDDRLGIGLSVVTIVVFALAAILFFIRWNKDRSART